MKIFQKKLIKKSCRTFILLLLTLTLAIDINTYATTITKPTPDDSKSSIHNTGITTYYNYDRQKWHKVDSSLLYEYFAKKSTKYYRPIYYFSPTWLPNNGQKLKINMGQEFTVSVTDAVETSLGLTTSSKSVKYATSVTKTYSKTFTNTSFYNTSYTFNLKDYPKKSMYRPAAFGNIIEFLISKENRITGNSSLQKKGYTFDTKSGLDLRLAWK